MPTGVRTFADVLLRGAPPDAVALADRRRTLTYGELAGRVADRHDELDLPTRSVVVLAGPNSIEYVVTYLALLEAGHVPLLAARHVDRLAGSWSPAAVVTVDPEAGPSIDRRRSEPTELHPELRLLMSTSGSTGSPKLVRLSDRNLESNARAIGEYLGIGPGDRGITSLPLHYCYGLSVLHSHLAAGAGVVVTDASVVDPCFRAAMLDREVTNVAGVPYTYEMLERVGPEQVRVPSLRFLTVAGGRLPPDDVRRWVERAAGWGADFYVMYGQTEATARMAYLPPAVARRRPSAVGVAVPGGELELRPVDGAADGVGELVYRGPNVMMGYAEQPADLALGPTLGELRTGDLGRFHADDGVFEVVGRRSRFVKPFGVRVDLDAVEADLRATWPEVAAAGDDDGVVVAVPGADPSAVARRVVDTTGLPAGRVAVDTGEVPRTAAGKVDAAALLGRHRPLGDGDDAGRAPAASVAEVYAAVLGRASVADTDTFVSLGGDSLSYVECATRLEVVLGRLPTDWHLRPVGELAALAAPRRRLARTDTTVVLRAVAICMVVATHMRLRFVPGGAHLLLAVVGFNLSRFMLPIDDTGRRVRAGLRTALRAAAPTVAWVAVGSVLGVAYGVGTLLLVNNYAGPASHAGDHWHFWFIEVFVHLTVLTTLLLAIPAVRRVERRWPYGFPLAVLGGALLLRLEWAQMGDWYNLRYRTHGVAWFFVLGWLVHRSVTIRQRLLTTAVCLVTVPGFFQHPERDWFIAAGLVVLVWCREVPLPRLVAPVVAVVAAASMWILLVHFTVWPPLVRWLGVELAYVPTIAAGVGAWALAGRVGDAVRPLARWWGSHIGGQRRGSASASWAATTRWSPSTIARCWVSVRCRVKWRSIPSRYTGAARRSAARP